MQRKSLYGWTIIAIAAIFLVSAISGPAFGSGLAIFEQSVSGLGNSFAGGAASAEDATTVFYNPAGMTRLPGQNLSAGVFLIRPTARFKNEGSVHLLGVPLAGGNGGEAGSAAIMPNLYYAGQISDRVWGGLGINSPFGLSTEYNEGWVGRYHALSSELRTANINPSVAFKLTRALSVAVGASAQYLDAELTNAIDFGTLDALPPALGGFGGAFGLIPQASDGELTVWGESWGYGFNLGALVAFGEKTRAGVAYRSRVRHEIDGTADFSGVPGGIVAATGGYFSDSGVHSTITMPASASASVVHSINPQWELMGDVTWTGWSTLEELRISFDNGQPDGVTTLHWKDTYRYSVGMSHVPNERWTFRAGATYDETPIPDARHRTPRLPGEDRISIAAGIGYRVSERLTLDMAYSHFFIEDPRIKKKPIGENALNGGLSGTYEADADIFAVQLNCSF